MNLLIDVWLEIMDTIFTLGFILILILGSWFILGYFFNSVASSKRIIIVVSYGKKSNSKIFAH